ncbi:MAG: DNA mismatch repair protein MutS [Ideonella sp. MAG2]|nr:MAG: DNA mismatch repair protein MutS [Ideonella sp. MAG2]
MVTVKDWKELGTVRQALKQARLQEEARQAQEAAEAARLLRERQLFALSVGPVALLKDKGRAELARRNPTPEPRQTLADEAAALRAALSDEVDLESLLLTDDGLSYRRPEVSEDVLARLRRGQWALQGEIDLHGLRRDEARDAVAHFILTAHRQGRRCLRVVHGKGHGSPGRQPVLKAKVQRWLAQRREVIAFTQASGPDGGAGALIVLLDAKRSPQTGTLHP